MPGEAALAGTVAVTAECRARLGGTFVTWTVGPVVLDAAASSPIDLGPPPAELAASPYAADYVASLAVDVRVGPGVVSLADAFVAYVDGVDEPPVIWSRAQLDAIAPHGVLSPALEADAVQWGIEGRLKAPYDPPTRPRKLEGADDDTGVARPEGP